MGICIATCKSGRRCRFPTMKGSHYCFSHDDRTEIADRRRRARVRGGFMHRQYLPKPDQPMRLHTIDDIRDTTMMVVRELAEGRLDIRSGNALIFACRTALRAAELAAGHWSPEDASDLYLLECELEALKEIVEHSRLPSVKYRALNRLIELRSRALALVQEGRSRYARN